MRIRRGPYYLVVYHSWIPVFLGKVFDNGAFQASTLGPVIFAPGPLLDNRVEVHEANHVRWWWTYFLTLHGFFAFTRPPVPVWLLLPPFAYFVLYCLAGFYAVARSPRRDRSRWAAWYNDNWYERDAREDAGEWHP